MTDNTNKDVVIQKWSSTPDIQVGRFVESEEEFNLLSELIESRVELIDTKLKELEALFGDDVDELLENMINTDQSIDALAMISIRENQEINEILVKRVDAKGTITRLKDRKTRERLATMTTGISKSTRRRIARKAAKTKRANPSINRRAVRKRKKAMRKRKAMGI